VEFQGTYRNAQIERISPHDIYAIIKEEARQQKHKHHQQQENTPAANNGEQHKNDNNNIKKYLEFNRDRILDFAQKNYENLVEVFTNNAINSAVTSSSNPTSSVPQSSSDSQDHRLKLIPTEQKSQRYIIIVKAILLIDLITELDSSAISISEYCSSVLK
jgi:hypothetical protein